MYRADTFVRSRSQPLRLGPPVWLPTAARVASGYSGRTSVPYIEDKPLIPVHSAFSTIGTSVLYWVTKGDLPGAGMRQADSERTTPGSSILAIRLSPTQERTQDNYSYLGCSGSNRL